MSLDELSGNRSGFEGALVGEAALSVPASRLLPEEFPPPKGEKTFLPLPFSIQSM